MPRKRNPENNGLPLRWRRTRNAYYYQVPKELKHLWDGRQTFKLGDTLLEASRVWAERVGEPDRKKTVADILDRYEYEIVPSKSKTSQPNDIRSLRILRSVFGTEPLTGIKPMHIYGYVDRRKVKSVDSNGRERGGLASARREIAVLSHAYTMAVKWGYIERHPFIGQVKLETTKPRTRYIEDWEIIECLSLEPVRNRGSVMAVQAYIQLKLLMGLRTSDLLRIRESDIREDGIHVHINKTDKPMIFEWDDEGFLQEAVQAARDARPIDISPFLFCTKKGKCYVSDKTGKPEGWTSMWQRFMKRVLKETKLVHSFTEHDLRAKCGSDAKSLEDARALLAHSDIRTTRRHYRRAGERVKPALITFK